MLLFTVLSTPLLAVAASPSQPRDWRRTSLTLSAAGWREVSQPVTGYYCCLVLALVLHPTACTAVSASEETPKAKILKLHDPAENFKTLDTKTVEGLVS